MKIILIATCLFFMVGCGPKSSDRNMKEAYGLAKSGQWEQVLEISSQRVQDVPNDQDAKVLKSLALMHLQADNGESMSECVALMRQAVSAHSDRYDYQLVFGWLLLKLNRNQEALEPLRSAYDLHIKLNKEAVIGQDVQGTIKYSLGSCLMKLGKYGEAAKYLEQALKSTPYSSWPSLYSDISCCYACTGQFQQALVWCNKGYVLAQNQNKQVTAGTAVNTTPYLYMGTLCMNMAVISDYLSMPTYNRRNSQAYIRPSIQWYIFAMRQLRSAYDISPKSEERSALVRQMQQADKRRVKQTQRLTTKR